MGSFGGLSCWGLEFQVLGLNTSLRGLGWILVGVWISGLDLGSGFV